MALMFAEQRFVIWTFEGFWRAQCARCGAIMERVSALQLGAAFAAHADIGCTAPPKPTEKG